MKNIIFIAPPAAGKGTQSKFLVDKYNYKHISTGDLLRNEISKNNPLASEIKKNINSGKLVPDDIVSKLLEQELTNYKGPFIFDGYPRNICQAENLERILSKLNIDLGISIYLDVKLEEAIKRATGRLICPNCNKSYNKYNEDMKPKVDNICDLCLVNLTLRTDDTKEAYQKRYETFITETSPLLKYYEDKGLLNIINNPVSPEETFKKIENIIL